MENIGLAFLGGIVIAFSTSIMLLFTGKITGISGILGSSLSRPDSSKGLQYSFLLGLVFGGAFLLYLYPEFFKFEINFSHQEAILAGLLVGFGTRLGSQDSMVSFTEYHHRCRL